MSGVCHVCSNCEDSSSGDRVYSPSVGYRPGIRYVPVTCVVFSQEADYSKEFSFIIREIPIVEWVCMCNACYTMHTSLKYTPKIWDWFDIQFLDYCDDVIDQVRETINQLREKNEQAEIEQEQESETYEYAYGGVWRPNVDLDDIKWGMV